MEYWYHLYNAVYNIKVIVVRVVFAEGTIVFMMLLWPTVEFACHTELILLVKLCQDIKQGVHLIVDIGVGYKLCYLNKNIN